MQRLLILTIFLFSFSFSYAGVYNQENAISIPYLINSINKFGDNDTLSEQIMHRKNILHKLSIHRDKKDDNLNEEALMLIFYMIKMDIGEEKFKKGMEKIEALRDMPSLTYLQILRSFQELGLDADDFYNAYFINDELTSITIENQKYITENGRYFITFTIERKHGPKILNIPYVLDYDNKKVLGRLQSTKDKPETFKIPVQVGAVKLLIDPNYQILRELGAQEKAPVIADILYKDDILFIANKNYAGMSSIFKNIQYIKEDDVKFKDLEGRDIVIAGYDNKIAKFFTDKRPKDKDTSEYFIFQNPSNKDKFIMIAENIQVSNLHLLPNYSFNGELIFKDDNLVSKNIAPTDFGIKVLEYEKDVIVDVNNVSSMNDVFKKLLPYKIIFVGERHTEYAHHLNQLQVINYLHTSGKNIAIAMEMAQAEHANILKDFTKGRITEKEMIEKIDYYGNWNYDYSLYAPIFKFARDNSIDIIPLNISKEITSKIYKGQIDNLTYEEANSLPKAMNIINEKYESKLESIYNYHNTKDNTYKFSDFYLSQNVWDEVMAKHIADYRHANPDTVIIVICGNGHAGKSSGIPLRYNRLIGENSFVIMQGEPIVSDIIDADIYLYPKELRVAGTPKIGVSILEDDEKIGVVKIDNVTKDSPADIAGLKAGDIITKCENNDIKSLGNLKYTLYENGYGKIINCNILRDNRNINKSIKLFEYEDKAKKHRMP